MGSGSSKRTKPADGKDRDPNQDKGKDEDMNKDKGASKDTHTEQETGTNTEKPNNGAEGKAPDTKTLSKKPQKKENMLLKMKREKTKFVFGKRLSKWEHIDINDIVIEDGDTNWFDYVDKFANSSEPVVVPLTKRKGWRTVRLFISSTFKDMHSEREHLVTLVLPVLRQWCEARRLRLIECDLRWGIPKDADTHETLLTCLSEIDRCRRENEQAYFLSMLSERYGFVMPPGEVPSDIKARYKWLPGMSITSLEIMTGAYWDKNPNALFMIRKPDFLPSVDKDVMAAYAEQDDEPCHSLDILKGKLRARFPGRVVEYGCRVKGREGRRMVMGDLDTFGRHVLDHFKARIHAQYPEVADMAELTDTEIRHAEQEDFMTQRSEVLLGRDEEISEIDAYISGDAGGTLLALVGFPGAGKSALMAYAAKNHVDNPQLKVFFHFVGVSPNSTSVFSVLARLYRECMPAERQASMPLDGDEMARFTPTLLHEAAREAARDGRHKLVVFIDALNQLDDKGNAHKLAWLPRVLPEGVRVVVSTLEGACLDALLAHDHPPRQVAVNPLSSDVRQDIAQELLRPYNKRLDPEQMKILVEKTHSGRPLYLSMACEELRVFGDFRKLTEKIRNLPDQLGGLVAEVLDRVVESFGGDVVFAALCYIESSACGLEEPELLRLLAATPVIPSRLHGVDAASFTEKLPMAKWGFIYVGLRSFLRPSGSTGSGRADFYHRIISKVVRRKYLDTKEKADIWHKSLIVFFSECQDPARQAEELPYHYQALGDEEGLVRCLTSRRVFQVLYREENRQQLMAYWQQAGGYEEAGRAYPRALKDILKNENLEGTPEGEQLWCDIALFLVHIGEYGAADTLLKKLIETLKAKHGEEAVELADPLHAVVELLGQRIIKFVYQAPRKYFSRGKEIAPLTIKVNTKKYGRNSKEMGEVLIKCGLFDEDWGMWREARDICEAVGHQAGLAVVLFNLAGKEVENKDLNVPVKMFEEALILCKLVFGDLHVKTARCLTLFGQMFWDRWVGMGTWEDMSLVEDCLPHYEAALQVLEELLGPHHPTTVRAREDVIILLQEPYLKRDAEAEVYVAQQPPKDVRDGIIEGETDDENESDDDDDEEDDEGEDEDDEEEEEEEDDDDDEEDDDDDFDDSDTKKKKKKKKKA